MTYIEAAEAVKREIDKTTQGMNQAEYRWVLEEIQSHCAMALLALDEETEE